MINEVSLTRRIASLIPSFRGGGTEGSNVRLANHMAKMGLGVDLVVLSASSPWREDLVPEVRPIHLNTQRAFRSIPALARYLRKETPVAFISNMSHLNVASAVAHQLANPPTKLILVERNDIASRRMEGVGFLEGWLRASMKAVYPWADRLLAVSRGAADSLADLLRRSKDSVGVLHNGLDLKRIATLANQPTQNPWLEAKGIPVVLATGRLVPQKAYPDLISAFKILLRDLEARLIIIGEGKLRRKLERLIARLELQDHVDMPGFLKKKPICIYGQSGPVCSVISIGRVCKRSFRSDGLWHAGCVH